MEFKTLVASDGQLYSPVTDVNALKAAEPCPEWVDVKAGRYIFWNAFAGQNNQAFWDAMFNS